MFELHSDTIQAGDQATTLSATDIAAICADLDANAHFVGNFESAIAELPNMPQGNDRDRQARLLLSAQTEVATIVIAGAMRNHDPDRQLSKKTARISGWQLQHAVIKRRGRQ